MKNLKKRCNKESEKERNKRVRKICKNVEKLRRQPRQDVLNAKWKEKKWKTCDECERKKEMTNASENEMMRIVFHSIIQFDNVHQFWCYRKKNSFPMHAFRHSMKLVYIVTIMDYRINHHLYSVVFFPFIYV